VNFGLREKKRKLLEKVFLDLASGYELESLTRDVGRLTVRKLPDQGPNHRDGVRVHAEFLETETDQEAAK